MNWNSANSPLPKKPETCNCDLCSNVCPACQNAYVVTGEGLCTGCLLLKQDELRAATQEH